MCMLTAAGGGHAEFSIVAMGGTDAGEQPCRIRSSLRCKLENHGEPPNRDTGFMVHRLSGPRALRRGGGELHETSPPQKLPASGGELCRAPRRTAHELGAILSSA